MAPTLIRGLMRKGWIETASTVLFCPSITHPRNNTKTGHDLGRAVKAQKRYFLAPLARSETERA